ncbi:siderophore-interacting protein [Variovorax dokdonensis]|uniref:Siderophore-interacting protein n=1 Tax=Variovorax dokdonensis TaxID=344883 RepID=A0ABT7N5M7_9BURK|nr:siderophore-interacting protein [Variovorax dokdonensis]
MQRVRHELRRRDVRLLRKQAVGDSFLSLTFTGDSLADFVSDSFDDHVKFMFDDGGEDMVRRDYTPRRFDRSTCELTIEFALHGHGAASQWALRAEPGVQAVIGGPRGSMIIPADYHWHLLAGDASALPAIHRRVEELPAGTRAIVLVQVPDASDVREMNSAADCHFQWVHSDADWLSALAALKLPASEGFAWCAGEARLMPQAREIVLQGHGIPRESARVAAYWKQGASEFHERLEG